jgi:hypothetical protein
LLNLSGSLGISDRIWANAFIKDISGLVNINGQPYGSGGGSGTIDLTNVTSNINPSIDNSGSLGISGRSWGNALICDLSISSIDVSLNCKPLITNNGSLGASNRLWGNAFIRDLSISSIDVSVNCNPLITNNGSLGASNRLWGNAFIRDLSISSIDVSVNCNPLVPNRGTLGSSTKIWGTAHIRDLSVSSITTTQDIIPLANYTGRLGVAGTNYLGFVFCNRLAITHHTVSQTGSIPSDSGGVGLLIENLNTSANQRTILFLRTSNSSLNSRAAITIVIGYAYGWQISVRQESPNNTLFFNNSEVGTGDNRVIFNSNGSASCTGTFSTSDDRLKHNEVIINNGLTIIEQLVPKFYQKTQVMFDAHYKGDLSGYTWFYEAGLIAQELLQIKDISFLVEGGDYYDSNNVFTQQPYSVCYGSVFIYGLAAIKELHAKVKTQESSIVNLESNILNQQTIINSLIARIAALKNKVS